MVDRAGHGAGPNAGRGQPRIEPGFSDNLTPRNFPRIIMYGGMGEKISGGRSEIQAADLDDSFPQGPTTSAVKLPKGCGANTIVAATAPDAVLTFGTIAMALAPTA